MTAPPNDPMANQGAPAVSTVGVPVNTPIKLEVTDFAVELQSRKFGTTDLDFWADGKPKLSVVVPVIQDGERKSLWIERGSQKFKAFADANNKALEGLPAGSRISAGWEIWLKVTGSEPSSIPGGADKKLYAFHMVPGTTQANPMTAAPQPEPPAAAPQQTWAPPATVTIPPQGNTTTAVPGPTPTQTWGSPPVTTDPWGAAAPAPSSSVPSF